MAEYKMRPHKFAKVGSRVFYDGREGEVLELTHIFDGTPSLGLVDVEDDEKTCTAKECDCISMDDYINGINTTSESGIVY